MEAMKLRAGALASIRDVGKLFTPDMFLDVGGGFFVSAARGASEMAGQSVNNLCRRRVKIYDLSLLKQLSWRKSYFLCVQLPRLRFSSSIYIR